MLSEKDRKIQIDTEKAIEKHNQDLKRLSEAIGHNAHFSCDFSLIKDGEDGTEYILPIIIVLWDDLNNGEPWCNTGIQLSLSELTTFEDFVKQARTFLESCYVNGQYHHPSELKG